MDPVVAGRVSPHSNFGIPIPVSAQIWNLTARFVHDVSGFSIEFGDMARTLLYRDAQGAIAFTFDGSDTGPSTLVLEHSLPRLERTPRYDIAFARTKEFLEARNYNVEVQPAEG